MFGKNPKRPPIINNGEIIQVQEIFPTIQGEGSNVGTPAVFIRLGGCNLACDFCDTEFESFAEMKLEDIASEIQKLSLNSKNIRSKDLVVITGGEPLRQNIIPLCKRLLDDGFKVQIETNGTLFLDLPKEVEIICSPKNVSGFYSPIRPDLLERVTAFKFIISASNKKYSGVAEVGQTNANKPAYVQPMDEQDQQKNSDNLELCKKLALENGYKISLQTHKIMGIR